MSKEELLAALARDLADLERYARGVTRDEFVADRDKQNMVLFAVYRVAQDLIDLASLVVAQRGLGVPRTYRDSLTRLAEAGVLDAPLASAIEGWVGLRNIIAHVYRRLDLETVYAAVADERDVLHRYLEKMRDALAD